MGFGGISLWQLLIILVIVVLLFGTKKLRTLGSDLGGALRGFKKAMSEDGKPEEAKQLDDDQAASEAKPATEQKSTANTSSTKESK